MSSRRSRSWPAVRRTVRFRTTAGAVLVIAFALVVAAVALDRLLAREVDRNFDASLATRAADRALVLDSGADAATVVFAVGDEEFVAVVDAAGTLVAQQGLADPSELGPVAVGVAQSLELTIFEHGGGETELAVVRVHAAATADGGAVLVGGEHFSSPQGEVRRILAIGVPLLIVVAAAAAWRQVGRSLAPVEELRSEVDALAGAASGERVTASPVGDELTRLADTMNGLLDRIDDHRVRQRRFVADASHELKSPVANVRALAETTERPLDDRQWADLQGRLVGEAERLRSLVDDLLFLARDDEGGGAAAPTLVHLDDIVFDESERAAVGTQIRVGADQVTPVDVLGDAAQLARMVRNLVDNAVRHAASMVEVAVRAEGATAVLVVDDDGDGIASHERTRVFERFARVDTDRSRQQGGTGLGLAIVQTIVRVHHGEVAIEDSPAGGARLVVRLPIEPGAIERGP